MAIDYNQLMSAAEGVGKDFFTILKPYLPLLGRSSKPFVEEFLTRAVNKDWPAIDKLAYKAMSPAERKELQKQVLSDAVQAAKDKYERKEMVKDVLLKSVLSLVVKLL